MTDFNVSRSSGVQYKSFSLTSKASAPDWERTPHKGMERPSEAEFNVKIDELAKGLAEARLQNDSIQYENLSLEGPGGDGVYLRELVSCEYTPGASHAANISLSS